MVFVHDVSLEWIVFLEKSYPCFEKKNFIENGICDLCESVFLCECHSISNIAKYCIRRGLINWRNFWKEKI